MFRVLTSRNLLVLISSLLVPTLFGCGGDSGGDSSGNSSGSAEETYPVEVASEVESFLRWNEYDSEFPMPEKRAWFDSDSADTADYYPHHQAKDLFLKAGESLPIEGRFHYGRCTV